MRVLLSVLVCFLFVVSPAMAGSAAPVPWALLTRYFRFHYQPDGRIVDHTRNDVTTSEGEAYALFFSLVDNDQSRFAAILLWIANNLAKGDLVRNPVAWLWGKNAKGTWGVLDPNTASDADLWIAYVLIEAGRLWHQPEYSRLGRLFATRIVKTDFRDLPGFGEFLAPGAHGFHPKPNLWRLNPSYTPPFILRRFQKEFRKSPWRDLPSLNLLFLQHVSRNGQVPDWATFSTGKGFVPDPQTPPVGSFDAIRVYLWGE